jgi:signal transduction histidine kinase
MTILCRIVALAFALSTGSMRTAAASPDGPSLTPIIDLHTHGTWRGLEPVAFRIRGTVTLIDPVRGVLVLQDETAAIAIHTSAVDAQVRQGDEVDFECRDSFPVIPAVPGYPFTPARADLVETLEMPLDWDHHNYVSRYRGYIRAPEDGSYRFWITSDDTSQLWLSEDDDPARSRLIARVPSWTDPREWSRFPEQRSASVVLEAGRRYYLEVLHEQGDGGSHLSVSWRRPTGEQEILAGAALEPWFERESVGQSERSHGLWRQTWLRSEIADVSQLRPGGVANYALHARDVRITPVTRPRVLPAHPIRAGQPLKLGEVLRWSEVTGAVTHVATEGSTLYLELEEQGHRLDVQVLNWSGPLRPNLKDYRVRLVGVAGAVQRLDGVPTVGTLFVPSAEQIEVVGQSPAWDRVAPTYINELLARSPVTRTRVKVRGRVVERISDRRLLLQDEGTFEAFFSSDGDHWRQLGEAINVPLPPTVYAGIAITSHHSEHDAAAQFSQMRGLNLPLEGTQVGHTEVPGSMAAESGQIRITARGGDIWNGPDQFFFAHGALTGDAELVVRLDEFSIPSPWSKAGILVRENLSPESPFVDLVKVGPSGLSLQWRRPGPGSRAVAVYTGHENFPLWLKLVRRHRTIVVATVQEHSLAPGERVEVVGYLRGEEGGATIADAFVAKFDPTDALSSDLEHERPLLDLSALHSLDATSRPDAFRIRAVVTAVLEEGDDYRLAVHDDVSGLLIHRTGVENPVDVRPGDFVEVYCDSLGSSRPDEIISKKVLVLGRAAFPRPLAHPMEQLQARRGEGRWIEIEGVVQAVVNGDQAVVRSANGYFSAVVAGMKGADWRGLVDARIRLRGVALYPEGSDLQVVSPGRAQLDVVAPAPSVVAGEIPAADLSQPWRDVAPQHRVRAAGVVTFASQRLLIIEGASGAASVRPVEVVMPPIGQRVEVIGFPETNADGTLDLAEAIVRPMGVHPLPPPQPVSGPELRNGSLGLRRVSIEAVVTRNIAIETGLALEVQVEGTAFRVWCPTSSGAVSALPEGSRVRLTGIVYTGPRVRPWPASRFEASTGQPFQFLAATTSDILLVQRPASWWLNRALLMIGMLGGVLLIGVVWVHVLRRRVQQRTRELEIATERLRREAEISATLSERNRLAGEIHDSLEQGFSGLMLQLDATVLLPDCSAHVREGIQLARRMAAFSRSEVRHAVWDLQSPVLEESDLATALGLIAQSFGAGPPQVTVATRGAPSRIASPGEHHLLRIAQEAMTNAVKHAQCTEVKVELVYSSDAVTLVVRDNGRGFAPAEVLAGTAGHFGLRSLRSRARKIGGTLRIDSHPGVGTTLELTLPLPATT